MLKKLSQAVLDGMICLRFLSAQEDSVVWLRQAEGDSRQTQTGGVGGMGSGHAMGKDRFAITRPSYWCRAMFVVVPTQNFLVLDVSDLLSGSVGCLAVGVYVPKYVCM